MTVQERIARARSAMPQSKWNELEMKLPPILRKGAEVLDSIDEKILFTLSMIAASSGLFTRVKGTYQQRRTYPNLFLIAMAPPASGKGLMAGARVALEKIHEDVIRQSKTLQHTYKEQLAVALKTKTAPPDKPPFVVLFMPGNCTSSKMISHIKDNGSNPIIILETEASTLAGANKSQYGDFSDLVRKAFQGETISYTRKFNDEFVEVKEPKLAIVLSGTQDQIIRLIGTAEDGTFSRYMFFSFNGKAEWQDANCKDCINFTDLLQSQQEEYYKLYKFFADRDVVFDFSEKQWDELNCIFRQELESVASADNVYAMGVVKRHGLMLFKMCMVLSAFRMYHLQDDDDFIVCADKDFEIARELISISLSSSLEVLEQLPAPQAITKGKDKKQEFLKGLKDRFTRGEAVEAGLGYKVSARTIDRWLEGLLGEGRLITEEHGLYSKVA